MCKSVLQKTMALVIIAIGLVAVNVAQADANTGSNANLPSNNECLKCHQNEKLSATMDGEKVSLYVNPEEYATSTHGKIDCTFCHTDIDGFPHEGAKTGKEMKELVESNCQMCHKAESKAYINSAHGKALKEGKDTASCTDCHGKHDIKKSDDPSSLANKQNVSETCMNCHQGVVAESYKESFHGKAMYLGSEESATCADCHGTHSILGQSDPESMVHKSNIPTTCAQCHNNPEPNFANGVEHYELSPEGPGKAPFWTLMFFVWLTISTIVVLVIHIQLELYRKYKNANK